MFGNSLILLKECCKQMILVVWNMKNDFENAYAIQHLVH